MKKILVLFMSIVSILACRSKEKSTNPNVDTQPRMTEAEVLLKQAIIAHGGELYDRAHYQFTFRDNVYSFHNSDDGYIYKVNMQQDDQEIVDELNNGQFAKVLKIYI